MAVAHFPCIQFTRVTPKGSCVFSVGNYSRSNYKRRYLVLASATKLEENFGQSKVETLLNSIKWNEKGLAVAIAQNVDTGAILMQGFVNRDALATTISSRKATFYSRSRSTLWTKGETSNNFVNVHDIFLDCDRDSIIYLGKPDGPTCHTGAETCYFTSVTDILNDQQAEENKLALTTLYSLESTISQRKAELAAPQNGKPSWTKRLLLDQNLLCSKIRLMRYSGREEADELCRTLEENEDKSRTASEMGDVLYHALVLLALKDVKTEDVLAVLRHRFSQSGIEEKKSRKSHS
ncbi:histidine biosynthesis bifunctional protein hisIE, chloroplastic isoform X2 [Mangifera indica]|uniref:histidine biosynthesis bifunctional protein hisIE, chloroplastic isoform X2 n=1 Tax=Mangifera indica TaxID=29780 RepID=UPI001CFA3BC8|nr:histidine biosynthesis bifunctional protein hisIE, chloroplastic isoform X2 [Mangifera indica]